MSVVVKRNDSKVVVNKKESNVTVNKNTLASSFSSFSAAGDSGTSAITNNETLTFTGGTGITSAVSNDEVTLNIDGTVLQNDDIIDGGTF
tara:strand:+ start:2457 stop:2726 length:270 start_codon:yes stop_codon:yes gene_type:complete